MEDKYGSRGTVRRGFVMYDIRDGIIRDPGKFEGERPIAVVLWNLCNISDYNDFDSDEDGAYFGFCPTPDWKPTEDFIKEFFAWIPKEYHDEIINDLATKWFVLAVDSYGFVRVFEFETLEDYEKFWESGHRES